MLTVVKENPDTTLLRYAGEKLHLELTTKCQLRCGHCYNQSSPNGQHAQVDWFNIISQAKEMGFLGVQFIGGEPFTHPQIYQLVEFALKQGLEVEIYSNFAILIQFDLLSDSRIHFATSFYSAQAALHESVTTRAGSFQRTCDNIREAVKRNLNLRIGVVKFENGENLDDVTDCLLSLGVHRSQIRVDRVRQIGRANDGKVVDPVSQLCGRCGNTAAVLVDGSVTSCPMARCFNWGNVKNISLVEALSNGANDRALLAERKMLGTCDPQDGCNPEWDSCVPDIKTPESRKTHPDCLPDRCDPQVGCTPHAEQCYPNADCNPSCGPD